MALSDYALTTYEIAKATLGLPNDDDQAAVERTINAVGRAMSRIAGRIFHRSSSIVEYQAGWGTNQLILDRAPIVSIASIVDVAIDDTTVFTYDSAAYFIHNEDGIVYRPDAWPWSAEEVFGIREQPLPGSERRRIKVTYSAGWITGYQASATYPGGSLGTENLPEDLAEAALQSVVATWQSRTRNRDVESETYPNASVTWQDNEGGGGGGGDRNRANSFLLPETEEVAIGHRRCLGL